MAGIGMLVASLKQDRLNFHRRIVNLEDSKGRLQTRGAYYREHEELLKYLGDLMEINAKYQHLARKAELT